MDCSGFFAVVTGNPPGVRAGGFFGEKTKIRLTTQGILDILYE